MVVCLAYGEHEVDLEVLDDGCGPDGAAVPGTADRGHGLVGMRERAALVGGSLAVGP